MWGPGWREALWEELPGRRWDLIVVGGGVVGAGILREAAHQGLGAVLLDGSDFAAGTSSRSSKYVHGGLRYLRQGRFAMVRASVRERERLIREAPGLVEPHGFLLPVDDRARVNRWVYPTFLALYDLLAGRRDHTYHDAVGFRLLAPYVAQDGLRGGFRYAEAQADDARLVLRLLREAVRAGGRALNYARIVALLEDGRGVSGVRVRDVESGREAELRANVVVNATGAWADELRREVGAEPVLRPLRGSHLVFAGYRLPVAQSVAFPHPVDGRMVSVGPWEGATIIGTTDLDHDMPLDREPRIGPGEVAYLMAAVQDGFPSLGLEPADAVASWAGVRAVVRRGSEDPAGESREHFVVRERGVITATGGKLTTFQPMARQALALTGLGGRWTGRRRSFDKVETTAADHPDLTPAARRRLLGRHGHDTAAVIAAARPGELKPVPGSQTLWVELRWAARAEGVTHLDDLLLRRARLGLLLEGGGASLLPRVRSLCLDELGWSDARWEAEETAYLRRWDQAYLVPMPVGVADESVGPAGVVPPSHSSDPGPTMGPWGRRREG